MTSGITFQFNVKVFTSGKSFFVISTCISFHIVDARKTERFVIFVVLFRDYQRVHNAVSFNVCVHLI